MAAAGEVTEESLFEKIGLGELALLDLTRTLIAQQGKADSETKNAETALDMKNSEVEFLKKLLLAKCSASGVDAPAEDEAPHEVQIVASGGRGNLNIRPKLLPTAVQRRLNAASKITFDTHEVYPATKPGERPPNEIELVT